MRIGAVTNCLKDIDSLSDGYLAEGDNLSLLSALPGECIDLVITDPPFFTGRELVGSDQINRDKTANSQSNLPASFDDRWDDLSDYLNFMRLRLTELHRVLKPSGSAVIHLDYRAVHEIKIELDTIFGRDRFINEIIWHYTGGGRSKRYFSRKHDTLLWYGKGKQWTFNIDAVRVPYKETSGYARGGIRGRSGKHYRPHPVGTPVDDVWDIPMINPMAKERCGYPTQKPEKLLRRLIDALSAENDLVLDPFCGSGTTLVAAKRRGRRWIGFDNAPEAIAIAQKRLQAAGLDLDNL